MMNTPKHPRSSSTVSRREFLENFRALRVFFGACHRPVKRDQAPSRGGTHVERTAA